MASMREEDLERLYARLEKPLCNVVFRWVWSLDEAQDIVQDAFVRLWRMRDRVDPVTVEPLIYKIALNLAASRRRSKRIWRWVSLEPFREVPSPSRSAEGTLMDDERHGHLRAAVEALPDELRTVVLLCEYSGLTYGQIGELLTIPAGTVGSRRNRALRELKRALSFLTDTMVTDRD